MIQTAGLPAGAGVFLGALARIACAIFTLTIRIAALGQFFTHRRTAYATHHACSRTRKATLFWTCIKIAKALKDFHGED